MSEQLGRKKVVSKQIPNQNSAIFRTRNQLVLFFVLDHIVHCLRVPLVVLDYFLTEEIPLQYVVV